tara:strand:- start:2462 stop:2764 length:303 start_codon:yes stop_codon:yes gene_type:complete
MSTSAVVEIKDENGIVFYLRRGHDGDPDTVMRDLDRAVCEANILWSCSEIGLFVSRFLGITYVPGERLHEYEMLPHNIDDVAYRYLVTFEGGKWQAGEHQ